MIISLIYFYLIYFSYNYSNSYKQMSSIDKELDEAIAAKDPQAIKKRKERKKAKKDIISTAPTTTQKGKTRITSAEKSLQLNKERLDRVVKRLPRTIAENNLLKASTKQLHRIATSLKLEGLSNLRKNDLVILIIREWNSRPTI